ncbi:C4-dicarboxylate ABC transporter [Primorskyibacter flagellatus]|uniref:C4-dicarboxylate ABC transporter n=1 Tax=Primorskyibacter flagellatus TaxID=1387277 RepID=A0A917A5J5_9RHOB|nr:TAXI family TRAP transporter solute-binding subunit [Primorskyibacter flagellatus]GGE27602.1 C4-dicarboxylate ABC transporter [Primorskyibacter flagellatus]
MNLGKLLGLAAFAATLGTAPVAAKDLLIGSTSASSSHYGYFVAVAKVINEQVDGASASVVETGASFDNLRRLERNQIDMGLLTTNLAQHALTGTQSEEGKPYDLRMLWVYSNVIQNVIVREDSGIESLSDLNGKRFNPGIKGSGTESTAEAVLRTLGIEPEMVRGSTTDVVGLVKDNRIAGYIKSGVGEKLDSSTLDIQTFTPIRVLSLTEEQKATLREKMPDISVVEIAGEGEVPARDTWSFAVGVVVPATMDEELAYQITKAILEDDKIQGAAMASVKGVDLGQLTIDYSTVPLHPGALRYFEESGRTVPDRLKPDAS